MGQTLLSDKEYLEGCFDRFLSTSGEFRSYTIDSLRKDVFNFIADTFERDDFRLDEEFDSDANN